MSDQHSLSLKSLIKRPSKQALLLIRHLLSHSRTLNGVYRRVGPDPPEDIEESIPDVLCDADPHADLRLFSYDEGHAGRFSVPGGPCQVGASMSFQHVMAQGDDPMKYIRRVLAFRPHPYVEDDDDEEEEEEEETCIFAPGLNTPHQPHVSIDVAAPWRMCFYSRILFATPLAQLHVGSALDQPDLTLLPTGGKAVSRIARQVSHILSRDARRHEEDGDGDEDGDEDEDEDEDEDVDNGSATTYLPMIKEDGSVVFSARCIDVIQAGLSEFNQIDTTLKQRFRHLFSLHRKMTLLVYSRSSIELKAALQQFIKDSCKKRKHIPHVKREVQQSLRDNVTVVTLGAACTNFPDGPKYLHVSALDDPLVKLRGPSATSRPEGGGKDAVYLHCKGRFAKGSAEHHNFAVTTAPLLSILLHANCTRSFAALWEKARAGCLVWPERLDDLVAAVFVVADARQWLFQERQAMNALPSDAFPNREDAVRVLDDVLGKQFVQRLEDAMSTLPDLSDS